MSPDVSGLSPCTPQAGVVTLTAVERDLVLAARLELIAEWHAGLRHDERADLREAAIRLRTLDNEGGPPLRPLSQGLAGRP